MPHLRTRFQLSKVKPLASLWPVVGVLGARQVGKTTLLESFVKFASSVSFDDEEAVSSANNSAKAFLLKLETPALIDEVQKVPKIFDALKARVHSVRKPGSYFITGSVGFSEGADIRESLTGRIGTIELNPMVVAEALEVGAPKVISFSFKDGFQPRVSLDQFLHHQANGGMPVPMFLRDQSQRNIYWEGWLSTTLLRDVARFFKGRFEPDFAYRILQEFGRILREGEIPTVSHFRIKDPRKLKRYLVALESVFLIRKIPCHEKGIGLDQWYLLDSGLCSHLMNEQTSEGAALSLSRHAVLNEIIMNLDLHQNKTQRGVHPVRYFKSARGTPIDFVVSNQPVKIVPLSEVGKGAWGWHAKSILGAQKKLGSKKAILLAPVQKVHTENDFSIYPFSIWS